MTSLEIRYRLISDLQPRKTNPRKHSKKQLEQLASSIRHYGFTNPVLIDEAGGVIAGHGRLDAAKILGMTEVPTVVLADMSEADVRSYVIADNQLALNAGWDRDLLGLEFKYLAELDFDFDLTTTGFERATSNQAGRPLGRNVERANRRWRGDVPTGSCRVTPARRTDAPVAPEA